MAIFKCKMCGEVLDLSLCTAGVCKCSVCNTFQTVSLKVDNSERLEAFFGNANHFRRNGEFDLAISVYQQILAENNEDPEAYFGVVLCRYGIDYVKDPRTKRMMPTVNRTQSKPVSADSDFLLALEYATEEQREIYKKEASVIDEILKGYWKISSNEEPFDVFICYKETVDDGETRTEDSAIAQHLYRELTRDGLKVFFARETLKDKLGAEYEPYIFAALNSSRVMLSIGTKKEYFGAVWVKNEWSRYLSLINQGERKTLIPVYKDMGAYDMPKEFSNLQAQNYNEIGATDNLIVAVEKIVGKGGMSQKDKELNTLIKRGYDALSFGSYSEADSFADKIISIEYENADAYIIKLLAELELEDIGKLPTASKSISNLINFKKAVAYSDGDTGNDLKEIAALIEKRLSKEKEDGEKRLAEQRRIEEEKRLAEQKRIEEEKRLAEQRLAQEKATGLYDVILTKADPTLLNTIKNVRELTSLGLKEATDLVKSCPSTLMRGVTRQTAEEALNKLSRVGASAKITPQDSEISASPSGAFDVILNNVGLSKLPVIKVIRLLTGLGLYEAKVKSEGLPSKILEGVSAEVADFAKDAITSASAGAEVELVKSSATDVTGSIKAMSDKYAVKINSFTTPPNADIMRAMADALSVTLVEAKKLALSTPCFVASGLSLTEAIKLTLKLTAVGIGADYCEASTEEDTSTEKKRLEEERRLAEQKRLEEESKRSTTTLNSTPKVSNVIPTLNYDSIKEATVDENGTLHFPKGTAEIKDNQFAQRADIVTVVIPSTVSYIGVGAFQECAALTSVSIPSSVKTIDASAFQYCESLTDLKLENGIESIGDNAFDGCLNLKEVILPESLTQLCNSAFYGCSSIDTLYIPKGIEAFGDDVFSGCNRIRIATLPTHQLSEITTDELERVTINRGNVIPGSAFKNCIKLKEVILDTEITEIEPYAFAGCTGLSTLRPWHISLKSIYSNAFESCYNLRSVFLSQNVEFVGKNAFKNCTWTTIHYAGKKPFLSSVPKGWDKDWNSSKCKVVWG